MGKHTPPDGDAMRRLASGLSLVVEGPVGAPGEETWRVRTRGLVLFDHPELVAELSGSSLLPGARSLLLRFTAHVVQSRGRLRPGAEVQVGAHTLRLERLSDGTLEVWELDPESGDFVRGASHTARSLMEEVGEA